ncbi:CTLH/CRA C-terminal to lish motif domain-containing protein [Fomitopsis serialis]|uniref:CTLH/CRA C-terminal to lish motif domain-containing protein n=1 Tax=Fomitopsis serialis TaxID=139415 RepID=UPI002008D563|nr:CTLH/CRA C-terminal to lish motif domain-containing protein [Neoantrodia serialis]KAH9935026.1 CTLH/CRA C-terminal to lish motif domain-containing protein [Neoantrodia serialis]
MYQARSQGKTRSLGATPDELRTLVLDYLCHNAYSKTVQAFSCDSAIKYMDADGDEVMAASEEITLSDSLKSLMASGESRKEIRICILSGQIDEAIELINKHFPSVLSENTETLPLYKTDSHLGYIPSTSVNPSHLMVNLHIQGFIEAAPTTGEAMDEDKEMADSATERLLHRAQNLYAEVHRLPVAEDRAQYLLELGRVGSLLAYTVPEKGPVTQYLGQDRREALADSIDSAILYRTEQPVVPKLELASRQTSVVWSMLHEQKVRPPPPSSWPAGVTPPGMTRPAPAPSIVSSKKSSEPDAPEVWHRLRSGECGLLTAAYSHLRRLTCRLT